MLNLHVWKSNVFQNILNKTGLEIFYHKYKIKINQLAIYNISMLQIYESINKPVSITKKRNGNMLDLLKRVKFQTTHTNTFIYILSNIS